MRYNYGMKKADPILYKSAVTFGRFNIAHNGHVELIQMMLKYAEIAYVAVSDGKLNNDWDLRVLLLKVLCRKHDVNLARVKFVQASNPFDAVADAVATSPFNEAVIVLGSDQMEMAYKLGEIHDCPWIFNGRTNSSTQMRFFLDAERFREDLLGLYDGCEYATTLAMILRQEERQREESCQTSRKNRVVVTR